MLSQAAGNLTLASVNHGDKPFTFTTKITKNKIHNRPLYLVKGNDMVFYLCNEEKSYSQIFPLHSHCIIQDLIRDT